VINILPHCPISSKTVLSNLKLGFGMTVFNAALFVVFWVSKEPYQYIFLIVTVMGIYCSVRVYLRYKKMIDDEKTILRRDQNV
jgi:hypothetical protein